PEDLEQQPLQPGVQRRLAAVAPLQLLRNQYLLGFVQVERIGQACAQQYLQQEVSRQQGQHGRRAYAARLLAQAGWRAGGKTWVVEKHGLSMNVECRNWPR